MNPFIRVIGICFFRVFIGAPVLQGLRIQIHIVFIDFDRVSQGDFPPGRNYRVMPSHAKSCQVFGCLTGKWCGASFLFFSKYVSFIS